MDPNLTKLADLVDALAAEQDAFLTEHAIAYDSRACHIAYERQEDAREALKEELATVLRHSPKILSSALRR